MRFSTNPGLRSALITPQKHYKTDQKSCKQLLVLRILIIFTIGLIYYVKITTFVKNVLSIITLIYTTLNVICGLPKVRQKLSAVSALDKQIYTDLIRSFQKY